jgi:hypothetical protein
VSYPPEPGEFGPEETHRHGIRILTSAAVPEGEAFLVPSEGEPEDPRKREAWLRRFARITNLRRP